MHPLWVLSNRNGLTRHVRFAPDSDRIADIAGGPFRAMTGNRNAAIIKVQARANAGWGYIGSGRPSLTIAGKRKKPVHEGLAAGDRS